MKNKLGYMRARASLFWFLKFYIMKYIATPILNLSRFRDIDRLTSQIDLFKQIFQEKSFCIIILDACRYDTFKNIYKNYIQGELKKVRSPGSSTSSFLRTLVNCPEFNNINILTSSPNFSKYFIYKKWLNSHHLPVRLDVKDIWKNNWDELLGGVSPEKVNESVIKFGIKKRSILWYMPPHFPWIEDIKFSTELVTEAIKTRKKIGFLLSEKVRKDDINSQRINELYQNNLRYSLIQISNLINIIRETTDRIVITSDHGELLGEYGLYFHYPNFDVPLLTTVPWLNVKI